MLGHVLVTGGAGYIGSHTTLVLLQAGFDVVVLDNLCNSSFESLTRVAQIAGRSPVFVQGDVRDADVLDRIFYDFQVGAVLHFAGLKAVGESVAQPLRYYDNNVHGSLVLLQACSDAGVFNFVFSSSATVYGEPAQMPISEACSVGQPTNPYGRSKLMVEDMLRDVAASDPRWRIAILRYFNPVGAHESGQIGEDPNGTPNNLLPYIAQVALGKLPELAVFGNDYPTPDGTGVRDYIHVEDLASAHIRSLDYLRAGGDSITLNCGYGHGYSVRELLAAVERACGHQLAVREEPRRPGDPPVLVAVAERIRSTLGWQPAYDDIDVIVRSALAWEQRLLVTPAS